MPINEKDAGARRGVVLITGGSSGIGRASVRAFAGAGRRVVFTYRSGAERAARLEDELAAAGVRGLYLDQGRAADVQRFVRALDVEVDVLVHCAALGSGTVADYAPGEPEQDEALVLVNALGPMWLTRALLPGMLARGRGTLVFLGSVGGSVTHFPGFRAADGMSKAALTFFARQLAAELAHAPVDVLVLSPGATDTPMLRASTLARLSPDERHAFEARLPRGRLIAPEEIAELLLGLCGPAARLLHGAVLDASQGLGVRPGLLGHDAAPSAPPCLRAASA